MSAKINLYSGLVTGPVTAVAPREGYVYVVTSIQFASETDSVGQVQAKCLGHEDTINVTLQPRHRAGWEGTLIIEHGDTLVVVAGPPASIRCTVEGYFLLDIPAFARSGAGALDAAYEADGAIHTQDSPLAKLTYLTLVELKRIRATLEAQLGSDSDRDQAVDEINRELES